MSIVSYLGKPGDGMSLKPLFPVRFSVREDGTKQLVLGQSFYRKWERDCGAETVRLQLAMAEASSEGDSERYRTLRRLQDRSIANADLLRTQWSPEAAEFAEFKCEQHRPKTLGELCDAAAQSERSEREAAASVSKVETFERPELYNSVTRKVSLKNETREL